MAEHHQPRWILLGGLGLTATLGVVHSLTAGFSQGGFSLPLTMAVLGGWWWWRGRSSSAIVLVSPPTPDRSLVQTEWAIVDQLLAQLQAESPPEQHDRPQTYERERQSLAQNIDRPDLTLAITGSVGTGKTTLLRLLQETGEMTSLGSQVKIKEIPLADTAALRGADAIMVLTGGDLTQSELNHLQPLDGHPAIVLAVNKTDHYLPDALPTLVAQIEAHLQHYFPQSSPIPVLTIAAQPQPIKRRKVEPDGTWREFLHSPSPQITPLLQTLTSWLQPQRASALVCATTYRQTQTLKQAIHQNLNELRREQSLGLIQTAQGMAAVATALNPIPTLDLLATLAVNGQLVVDLARLYHQPLTLKQGETIASTLGALLLKLGLVELSTQTLSALLKTYQGTYVAGAILQGMSAAYLTRVAGLTIVTYLESLEPGSSWNQTQWNDRLQNLLQSAFHQLQEQAFLRSFFQTMLRQLSPNQ